MPDRSLAEHLAWQADVLPQVSRTFALTIPRLPDGLADVVGNAYLLCRIADAIEDDENVPLAEKHALLERFIDLLHGNEPANTFARDAAAVLTDSTIEAERLLVADTARAVEITRTFDAPQRAAIRRCVEQMCRGMPLFQHADKARGVQTMADLDRYCYFVAGVVGEMLTDLFCHHAEDIGAQYEGMRRLDTSFGQGLQMVNILKDVWEDAASGSCWLPRDVFAGVGYDLDRLAPDHDREAFARALRELLAIAHGHLRNALDYTLLIPSRHTGIRLFCLWSIGLAVLTLRRLHANPMYTSAEDVKVSRRAVAVVMSTTRISAARGLPRCEVELPRVEAVQQPAPPGGDVMVTTHNSQ